MIYFKAQKLIFSTKNFYDYFLCATIAAIKLMNNLQINLGAVPMAKPTQTTAVDTAKTEATVAETAKKETQKTQAAKASKKEIAKKLAEEQSFLQRNKIALSVLGLTALTGGAFAGIFFTAATTIPAVVSAVAKIGFDASFLGSMSTLAATATVTALGAAAMTAVYVTASLATTAISSAYAWLTTPAPKKEAPKMIKDAEKSGSTNAMVAGLNVTVEDSKEASKEAANDDKIAEEKAASKTPVVVEEAKVDAKVDAPVADAKVVTPVADAKVDAPVVVEEEEKSAPSMTA